MRSWRIFSAAVLVLGLALVLLLCISCFAPQAQWQHWGVPGWMGWWAEPDRSYSSYNWMPFPFFGIACFVFFLIIAALLIAAVAGLLMHRNGWSTGSHAPSPLRQLDARYAAGAIGRDAYLKQKNALTRKG